MFGPENQCPHVCGGADDSCRMLCPTANLCENNLQACVPLSVQSLFVVGHDILTVQRRVMHCDHDSFCSLAPCVLRTKQVGLVQRLETVVVNEIREILLQQV